MEKRNSMAETMFYAAATAGILVALLLAGAYLQRLGDRKISKPTLFIQLGNQVIKLDPEWVRLDGDWLIVQASGDRWAIDRGSVTVMPRGSVQVGPSPGAAPSGSQGEARPPAPPPSGAPGG